MTLFSSISLFLYSLGTLFIGVKHSFLIIASEFSYLFGVPRCGLFFFSAFALKSRTATLLLGVETTGKSLEELSR